jgi:23S rRNA pseudouridine2605 synthase
VNDLSLQDKIRLQVYLAHAGVASRRASEEIITSGRVAVNGEVVTELGTKVSVDDKITVDGKVVTQEEQKRYVLLHKPAGYVCSLKDEKGRQVAADLLKPHFPERLYNVGRLDMFSAGLIIFTNDGDFAAKVSHPSSEIEKEYIVETSVIIPEELPTQFLKGIRIEGVFYKAKQAELLGKRRLRVVLIEGKNREIRKVMKHIGLEVSRLIRLSYGPFQLGSLRKGEVKEVPHKTLVEQLGNKFEL